MLLGIFRIVASMDACPNRRSDCRGLDREAVQCDTTGGIIQMRWTQNCNTTVKPAAGWASPNDARRNSTYVSGTHKVQWGTEQIIGW